MKEEIQKNISSFLFSTNQFCTINIIFRAIKFFT